MFLIKYLLHKLIAFYQKVYLYVRSLFHEEIVVNCTVNLNKFGFSIKHGNFGDDINVPIIESLSGKKVRLFSTTWNQQQENILAIGSIIEMCCTNNSIIWGSGAMYGTIPLTQHPKRVCAVRGILTRQYLMSQGIECPEIYGDPALLLPTIYTPRRDIKYEIGIIPHYVDYDLPHVRLFRSLHPEVLFIDLRNYKRWQDIIDSICSCKYIASSSLHGLIVSDAYNIPNIRIILSNNIEGGDFKYEDYYSGVGRINPDTIDCREKIDFNVIRNKLQDYTPINFDIKKLFDSFPYSLKS